MKDNLINDIKMIQQRFEETRDVEELEKSIQELPLEIIELFNEIKKSIKNEK
jgi:DNA-binding ferritin-like protein (Dps family)